MISLTDSDLHYLHEIAKELGVYRHFRDLPHYKGEHRDKPLAERVRLYRLAVMVTRGQNDIDAARP